MTKNSLIKLFFSMFVALIVSSCDTDDSITCPSGVYDCAGVCDGDAVLEEDGECHDDHDHDDDGDDHTDADGFVLESNGVEVYREFEGAITNNLNLSVNGTLDLSVHFLDHEGNEIEHEDEEGEEEDELSFVISDSQIVSIMVEEHEEDGNEEEHHELGFELTGLSVGSTTFTLSLMHGDHADYTSLPISITVSE